MGGHACCAHHATVSTYLAIYVHAGLYTAILCAWSWRWAVGAVLVTVPRARCSMWGGGGII